MSAGTPDREVHVAGVVVHARPDAAARIAQLIEGFSGAHVHAVSRDGKLVVTLEAASAEAVADGMSRMQSLDDVLAASLVYQHSEPAVAMDEEVEVEDHAQAVR